MKIIQSHSLSVTYNLAFEEYLFTEFQEDFLLFYVNDKSVVLGSNQSVRNEVNVDFCKANNIQLVRRKSGGGAVFHDLGNFNFSFIGTKNEHKNLLSGDFLLPVITWLNELGVVAKMGERKDLWLPDGYKITGTASHISKNRELHHGTLLVDANLELLQQALFVQTVDNSVKATASVRSKTKNIIAYLQENELVSFSAALFVKKIIYTAEKYYHTTALSSADFDQEEILKLEKNYKSDVWTFKK